MWKISKDDWLSLFSPVQGTRTGLAEENDEGDNSLHEGMDTSNSGEKEQDDLLSSTCFEFDSPGEKEEVVPPPPLSPTTLKFNEEEGELASLNFAREEKSFTPFNKAERENLERDQARKRKRDGIKQFPAKNSDTPSKFDLERKHENKRRCNIPDEQWKEKPAEESSVETREGDVTSPTISSRNF